MAERSEHLHGTQLTSASTEYCELVKQITRNSELSAAGLVVSEPGYQQGQQESARASSKRYKMHTEL